MLRCLKSQNYKIYFKSTGSKTFLPFYFDTFDITFLSQTYLPKLFWGKRYIIIVVAQIFYKCIFIGILPLKYWEIKILRIFKWSIFFIPTSHIHTSCIWDATLIFNKHLSWFQRCVTNFYSVHLVSSCTK